MPEATVAMKACEDRLLRGALRLTHSVEPYADMTGVSTNLDTTPADRHKKLSQKELEVMCVFMRS